MKKTFKYLLFIFIFILTLSSCKIIEKVKEDYRTAGERPITTENNNKRTRESSTSSRSTTENIEKDSTTSKEKTSTESSKTKTTSTTSTTTKKEETTKTQEKITVEEKEIGCMHENLSNISLKESTCISHGNVAGYFCNDCERYLTEDYLITTVDRLSTPLKEHNLTFVKGTGDCITAGTVDHYHCSLCNKDYDDNGELLNNIYFQTKASHSFEHVDGGNYYGLTELEHYYCADCNKYFNTSKVEVNESEVKIYKEHEHDTNVTKGVYPTFTYSGQTDYIFCTKCGQYVKESEYLHPYGTILIADYDIVKTVEEITYTYTYTIDVDTSTNNFVMTELIGKNNTDYVLKYFTGSLSRNDSNNVYRLTYNEERSQEFVKFRVGAFDFVNSDGTSIEDQEVVKHQVSNEILTFENPLGSSRYGYDYFTKYEFGAELESLYLQYLKYSEGFMNSTQDVPSFGDKHYISYLDLSYLDLSYYEISAVWSIFYKSNPKYYFIDSMISSYTFDGRLIVGFNLSEEYVSFSKRDNLNNKVQTFIDGLNNIIDNTMSDKEKVKSIHDYLLTKIDYAYKTDGTTPEDAIWAHNIIGAVSYNKGVCECYAKTMEMLLSYAGIECIIVSGFAGEPHAWNLVKIDGIWYGLDATWDDQTTIIYNYFLVSESVIHKDREINSSKELNIEFLYEIPEVSSTNIGPLN